MVHTGNTVYNYENDYYTETGGTPSIRFSVIDFEVGDTLDIASSGSSGSLSKVLLIKVNSFINSIDNLVYANNNNTNSYTYTADSDKKILILMINIVIKN